MEKITYYVFILKTTDNVSYVSDDSEVIGDKFEVIGILERKDLVSMFEKYDSINEILENERIKIKSLKTMLKIHKSLKE